MKRLLLLLSLLPSLLWASGPFTYQVAEAVPFDGSGAVPPFVSDNAKDAIIEARDTAPGSASRYAVISGYQGTSDNVWLEFFRDISSNNSPFVIAEGGTIRAFSLGAKEFKDNDDIYIDVYKNGTGAGDIIYTFIMPFPTPTVSFAVTGLDLPVASGDRISVKSRAKGGIVGEVEDPVFTIFVQTN